MTVYLSRFEINRTPQIAALGGLLDPDGPQKLDTHHKLIWTAFAGDTTSSRDFLWRDQGKGVFLVLSHREPQASPVFEPLAVKEFAPELAVGDRLAFALRANATRTEKTGQRSAAGKEKKRHIDLVMDRLPPKDAQRAAVRMDVAQTVAQDWLTAQGGRAGFRPDQVVADEYRVQRFRRRQGLVSFGVLDLTGQLTVTDPAVFIAALARGFGRAKAFGCGLMLIRRV